mgnify:CR=1 FL=1
MHQARVEESGKSLREAVAKAMARPSYKRLSEKEKAEALKDKSSSTRGKSTKRFKREYNAPKGEK